ncbi:MAG: CHAT domain-containing protein [Pseudomonadota bacterium]
MTREVKNISSSQQVLKFRSGTQLFVAPFVGVATQWANDTGSFRAFRLPSEEDTSLVFQEAMVEQGIYEQETIHMDVTGPGRLRGFNADPGNDEVVLRPAHTSDPANAIKVVLYQDESGGMSWHFPDGFFASADPAAAKAGSGSALRTSTQPMFTIPTRTVAARRSVANTHQPSHLRGPITKWGRKIFKVLVLPLASDLLDRPMELIVGKIESKYRQDLVRSLTVDNYRARVTAPFGNWAALDGKRSLLVVHGIFSSTDGMLSLLPRAEMARIEKFYEGRMIALDQLTVSKSPEDNARFFLQQAAQAVPGGRLEFDILCHSRGGIVARALVEQGLSLLPNHPCRFRKVYFAATPNQGSMLADPAHIVDMLDVFTNMLTNFPDGAVSYSVEVFLAIIKLLAYTAERSLPGLSAMGTESYITRVLNSSRTRSPAAYASSASNYIPDPKRDNAFFNGRFADYIIDRIFSKDGTPVLNDLVVPQDGVHGANGHPSFPIQDALVYEDDAHVWHTGFFEQPRTINHILKHFGVASPILVRKDEQPVGDDGMDPDVDMLIKGVGEAGVDAADVSATVRMRNLSLYYNENLRSFMDAPHAEIHRNGAFADTVPIDALSAGPIALQRKPEILFHEQVTEGDVNDLTVRLDELVRTQKAEMDKILDFAFAAGEMSLEITVILSASGFDLVGLPFQQMTVQRRHDPRLEQVVFQLIARNLGPEPKLREITATFYLRNSGIGSVTHRTIVVPKNYQGVASGDGSSISKGFVVHHERREDCDLIINVVGKNESGQPPFRIYLRSELPNNAYSGKDVGEFTLPGNDLAQYLDDFSQPYITQFPKVQIGDEAQFPDALKAWEKLFSKALDQFGKKLWTLLPLAFRNEYFKIYLSDNGPRSIAVHSDEMIFPWELVVPNEIINGKLVVLEPLGISHILGRWKNSLPMKPIPQNLPVRNFCVLNPAYAVPNALPWSLKESKALQKLFPQLFVVKPADLNTVETKVLNHSDIQILHFTGHGQYDLKNSDLSRLLLEGNDTLDTFSFSGTKLCAEASPIIYLNACSVGSTGLVVGRMGGFAASFLENGCSGVIAPYWPINDARAAQFSVSLYQKLQKGRAIGEALQELRSENKSDPTFRAYSYFGDPWARMNFSPS